MCSRGWCGDDLKYTQRQQQFKIKHRAVTVFKAVWILGWVCTISVQRLVHFKIWQGGVKSQLNLCQRIQQRIRNPMPSPILSHTQDNGSLYPRKANQSLSCSCHGCWWNYLGRALTVPFLVSGAHFSYYPWFLFPLELNSKIGWATVEKTYPGCDALDCSVKGFLEWDD